MLAEVSVNIPPADIGDGIFRINADSLTVGLDGIIVTFEFAVNDPEAGPSFGIFRIDA